MIDTYTITVFLGKVFNEIFFNYLVFLTSRREWEGWMEGGGGGETNMVHLSTAGSRHHHPIKTAT